MHRSCPVCRIGISGPIKAASEKFYCFAAVVALLALRRWLPGVLCEQGQNFLRIESVKVVDEGSGLTEPLTVEFAPEGLCPAGIGNG